MKIVSLSQRAQRDLADILAHIGQDSPIQAVMMVDRLEREALELRESALLYQRVPHAEYPELRRRVVGSYSIVYSVDGERVDVLFIAHGARDILRLLYPDD